MTRTPLARILGGATGRTVLVSAPGGYGKTSQTAAWAQRERRPVAWLDLEEAHDDPVLLVHAVAELVCRVTGRDPEELLHPLRCPADALRLAPRLRLLLADAPTVLVLDDLHRVSDPEALAVVRALAEGVALGSTVVLLSRTRPSVPLARLREQQLLVEVGTDALALDAAACRAVLAGLEVDLPAHELEQLVEDTEGWPVGVRLHALALRDGTGLRDGVAPDRTITAYVQEEWLRGLSEDQVEFLTRLSGLEWLTPALCDHVLERSDSGALLDRLSDEKRLVIALDRRGASFRMHRLLRDVLEAGFERSARDERLRLEQRSSEWFEQDGDIDRAVRHAMRAGDLARAERLIDEHAMTMHTAGRHTTVKRWIDQFPRSEVLASARLCVAAGVTSLGLADGDAARAWSTFAAHALAGATPDGSTVEHKLSVLRATVTSDPAAGVMADLERACSGLPPGVWHASATSVLGALSFSLGHEDRSVVLLNEAIAEGRVVGAPTAQSVAWAHLAMVHGRRGDWASMVRFARQGRDVVRSHHLELMPTQTHVLAVSALAEALDGQVSAANTEIAAARRTLGLLDSVGWWANVLARVALAHASLLVSDLVSARSMLREAELFVADQPDATVPRELITELWELVRTAKDLMPVGASSLTPAELRVLHYLPTNLSLADIADELYVSRNTAKSHAASVYRKFGVTSRRAAVEAARGAGLLASEGSVPGAVIRAAH